MEANAPPMKRFDVMIGEAELEKLRAYSKRKCIPMSVLVRLAIEKFLEAPTEIVATE